MTVYAVMRIGRGLFDIWHVHLLFAGKKDAMEWIAKKNPNACRYDYQVKRMKVQEPTP
jgi:hypothetical protein